MPQQLKRIEAKLRRADEHLEVLNHAIDGFLESDPYRPFPDTDPKTGERLVRVEILKRPPVLDWGVLIGDVLHNLRSGLDHLAWILGGDPPPNEASSEFPIFWSRTDYRRAGVGKIPGVCDHAQAIIEDVQPYHRGDERRAKRHPLWFLHALHNADKHRLLHVAGSSIGAISYWVGAGMRVKDDLSDFNLRTFTESGAEIARWRTEPSEPEVEMPFDFTFHIAFDEEGPGRGNPVRWALPWVRDVVRDRVLARLAPFLS